MNPSSSSFCSACGSALTVEHQTRADRPSGTTKSKSRSVQLPLWLRAVLGVFGIYVLVVIVFEIQNMPSGSIQKNQQQDVHDHTDPAAISNITEMEKQLASDPKNSELLLQFANMLHDAKFFPRAAETYKKYLALVPTNNDARVDLGICYYEIGNLALAVKEIESVIAVSPKHQMAMFNLGIIQMSSQNMDESKKWLKKCIEIDPQSTAGLRAQQLLQQHQ